MRIKSFENLQSEKEKQYTEITNEEFRKFFNSGEIKKINLEDLSPELLSHFENKGEFLISRDLYVPGNFDSIFLVEHDDGSRTYIAQQTKNIKEDYLERNSFLVDEIEGELIGYADLCKNLSANSFNGKDASPFVGFNRTFNNNENSSGENFQKQGLGQRRLILMNAISQILYGEPLSSGLLNEHSEATWNALFKKGLVEKMETEKFGERFVFKKENIA